MAKRNLNWTKKKSRGRRAGKPKTLLGKVLEPNYSRSGRMLHKGPERITTQYLTGKRKYVSVPASL